MLVEVLIHEAESFNGAELESYAVPDLLAYYFKGVGVGGRTELKALRQPLP